MRTTDFTFDDIEYQVDFIGWVDVDGNEYSTDNLNIEKITNCENDEEINMNNFIEIDRFYREFAEFLMDAEEEPNLD